MKNLLKRLCRNVLFSLVPTQRKLLACQAKKIRNKSHFWPELTKIVQQKTFCQTYDYNPFLSIPMHCLHATLQPNRMEEI